MDKATRDAKQYPKDRGERYSGEPDNIDESNTWMQKRLVEIYPLIREVCKNISKDEGLAHDTLLKLNTVEGLEEIPDKEIRFYVHRVAKNIYINQRKGDRFCTLLIDIEQEEDTKTLDPYDYIQAIKKSDLSEIEKLWLDTYLDWETYVAISEIIDVSRQTISKHVKEVCKKLKK